MSGAALPYRLRPHKAVDRRLFLDLLSRVERWHVLAGHAYISMGGYGLEDHKLIHRLIGISRLLAFDKDADVVARQAFNRPTADCKCVAMKAKDVVADVDTALSGNGIEDAAGYIVWLDYMAPKDIFKQLNEFAKLVAQFKAYDVVKITINAQLAFWGGEARQAGNMVALEERQIAALEKLTGTLGEFMPTGIAAHTLTEEGLAKVLGSAFGKAADKAVPAVTGLSIEPICVTRYKDGQQMLSMTAIAIPPSERVAIRGKMGLDDWPFASKNWTDVQFLAVPDLTVRERLYLERNAQLTRAAIKDEVGFDFDAVTEMAGFTDNFRRYYRMYPVLTPVEL